MKALVVFLFALSCAAQSDDRIVFSGSLRARLEAWDWFQPSSGENAYAYSGDLLRLNIAQKRASWDWDAEFAVPFLLGLPANPFAPGTQGALGFGASYLTANHNEQNTAMIFPKQLYAHFPKLGLKIGRFEFLDGTETTPKDATLAAVKRDRVNARLLGNFSFSDVGRSFDGLQYGYTRGATTVSFVGAVPTRGVFQVDGWGWVQAAFGYASVTHAWGKGETRAFALYYDDWRPDLKVDNRPLAARRADTANLKIWTFGGHSAHVFDTRAGSIDLMAWGAAQTGRWGTQNHLAHSYDLEGGIQPKILPKLKPWLRGGFSDSSGDGNPNDNLHETFFQVLPTPRPFARFPFFNMMNNRDRFGMLILRPHPKVTTSSEFHALALSNPNDLWYAGGGAFQPWTFGFTGRAGGGRQSLANLYDTSLEYRVNPRLTFTAYYGYAQGRAVTAAIYPQGKDGMFGYLEAFIRF